MFKLNFNLDTMKAATNIAPEGHIQSHTHIIIHLHTDNDHPRTRHN